MVKKFLPMEKYGLIYDDSDYKSFELNSMIKVGTTAEGDWVYVSRENSKQYYVLEILEW